MNRRDLLKSATWAAVVAATRPASAADAPPATSPATVPAGRSILLYSGWATHNIGDVGHTPGTLRYLTQHLPGVRVTCWLRRTNDAVNAMLRARFPNVALVQGDLDNAGKASMPELQQAFDGCDLFVQNSGMHFNQFWAPPIGLLLACEAKKKKFGLYAQSFDGFRPQDADRLPQLFSKASFIFTRDTESLRFLRTHNVTPGVLEFGPDGCFGIDVRDDAKAEAFMAESALEPRKFVAVIVRTDQFETRGKTTGVPEIDPAVKEKSAQWLGKVIEVVTAIVRRTGLKVALVPEVEKEIAAAKSRVFDVLPDDVKSKVVQRSTWWNADEACSLYARAHSLVAMEPHSCIMALAAGTPAIHAFSPSHGSKAWMFRDVGLSEWLIDIDAEPASTITRAWDRIHDRYGLAREKAKRAMDGVNRRSAEMMADVAAAVG